MAAMEHTVRELSETAAIVQQVWADLLGLAAVAPDDDFFELGGHSLMAAAAVARMGAALGLDLPPLALFEAPTPAEMAELVAEVREGRRFAGNRFSPVHPPWVVPLQREGHRRPVFVFPAGHDEIAALAIEAKVAVYTGRDRSFWGFRRDDSGLARARAGGVPAMAAVYISQIRAIQATGPYLLYANCAGGPYAWEVAAQLLAAGHEIAGILFYEVPLDPKQVAPAPVITPVRDVSTPPTADTDYQPAPLPVPLTLIVTEFWQQRRWSDPWRRVAMGETELVVIPDAIVSDPAQREQRIAVHVREWIERSEARFGGV